MTNLSAYIQKIKIHLINTHSEILNWFNEDEKLKKYQPNHKGWTINEILEHIALTSHFLLIFVDKGTNKAIKNCNCLPRKRY